MSVLTFLCKAEPDDLKQAMQDLFENMGQDNLSKRTKLLKIGCCLLKTRKLSAQEAAYRLARLKLVHSSRAVLFLNTKPFQKRYKVLKTKEDRDQLPDDSEDIFLPNVVDYYQHRPNSFQNWSLFAFASWFSIVGVGRSSRNSSNSHQLRPPFEKKQARQRQKPYVVRLPYTKYDTDDYYYSLLLTHLPHRHESELLLHNGQVLSPKKAFEAKHHAFDTTRLPYNWFTNDIETQVRRIRLSRDDLANLMLLSTHEPQQPAQPAENYTMLHIDQHNDNTDAENCSMNFDKSTNMTFHSLLTTVLSEEEIDNNIQQMTNDQKNVFNIIRHHYVSDISHQPLRIFITGGAGVGKTFLTNTVCDWIRNVAYKTPGTNPVIICAPTGVAAHNVHGHTIHSALSLAVQHGYEPAYEEVSSLTLKKLRTRFHSVHTLIIDEISMVSANT